MKLYNQFAKIFNSVLNNSKNKDKLIEEIEQLTEEYMLSGSGFDSGTSFNFEKSKKNKLIWNTAFHIMNDSGYYTHWIENITITITPDLQFGFNVNITGRFERNDDLIEYIEEHMNYILNENID